MPKCTSSVLSEEAGEPEQCRLRLQVSPRSPHFHPGGWFHSHALPTSPLRSGSFYPSGAPATLPSFADSPTRPQLGPLELGVLWDPFHPQRHPQHCCLSSGQVWGTGPATRKCNFSPLMVCTSPSWSLPCGDRTFPKPSWGA